MTEFCTEDITIHQRHVFDVDTSSDRFYLRDKLYNKQFNQMYTTRLNMMQPILSQVALEKWGINTQIFSPLIEVESFFLENPDNNCLPVVIIGNVFKELTLRPSALTEERENENDFDPLFDMKSNFFSSNDKLFLEDESGRIEIISDGEWLPNLVTGVTIAVLGLVNDEGQFVASEYCTAYPDFTEVISTQGVLDDNPSYILLVSGLEFGSSLMSESNSDGIDDVTSLELSAQMLSDFVSGRLGGDEHASLASRIGRVIIAGNSINSTTRALAKTRTMNAKNRYDIKSHSKQFDMFLFQLLGSCPVDVMPGTLDPTNNSMPQQPLNPCFTPQSDRFSTYHACTNPYELSSNIPNASGMVHIIGHSGSPVDDISRQIGNRASVEILCDTLKWGNMCPTAPDTLPSYPYQDNDPFIIQPSNLPHIYFAGNQDSFDTKLMESSTGHRVRVICVPKFSTTREVVLVNLSNLSCEVLRFGI